MTAALITIVVACIGSSGLWTLIQNAISNRRNKKTGHSTETKLLLGLAYAKIVDLCTKYLEQGYITKDQYEDLMKYLYEPYKDRGGDGTVEKLIEEVKKLPMRG